MLVNLFLKSSDSTLSHHNWQHVLYHATTDSTCSITPQLTARALSRDNWQHVLYRATTDSTCSIAWQLTARALSRDNWQHVLYHATTDITCSITRQLTARALSRDNWQNMICLVTVQYDALFINVSYDFRVYYFYLLITVPKCRIAISSCLKY